jgi:hypothetical protein
MVWELRGFSLLKPQVIYCVGSSRSLHLPVSQVVSNYLSACVIIPHLCPYCCPAWCLSRLAFGASE